MYLKGPKVSIRTIVKQDLHYLVKWKNDPLIGEMVSGHPIVTTLDLEERRYEKFQAEYNTLRLMIEDKHEVPIGFISVCEIDKYNKKADLGILIGKKQYWGMGYGTDALSTIVDYLFNKLGLNRVGIEVFDFNERAKNLYIKLGFVIEGIQRQGLKKDGSYSDILIMGLLKKEFIMNQKNKEIDKRISL